ncbi:MAG: class II aldolase/adducin family protein [Candidatus Melainabacteria bacterium]|nr:class II aldolase/adducin family protein [Candidatus Melainabacteria bacterium]
MPIETKPLSEATCREDLKKVCNLAYKRGLVSGMEGNFSLKINNELILVTPRNTHKGLIEVSDFVVVDMNGNIISNGSRELTSELSLHLEAYKKRTDIKAVVHAHPPATVSFSVAGIDFNQPVIPETIVLLGEIPTVPYREPGTNKLGELVGVYIEKHDAVILERHGVVTVGKDIFNAYCKLESLEHAAKIMYFAHTLGDIKTLDEVDVNELIKQRHETYGKELEDREGKKLFQSSLQTFKLKNLLKKLTDGNSPLFQRLLNLSNELMLATLQRTNYSQKLTSDEKEQLARELTASSLSMILGRFTKT